MLSRAGSRGMVLLLFSAATMFGTTYYSGYWNWRRLFSYGEVVCFVSAWIVGLLVAIQGQQADGNRPTSRTFAAVNETLGIQANLGK